MKNSKAIIVMFIVFFMLAFGSGCGLKETGSGKLKLMVTLFPQYDFAREIGKEKVDVRLLLPPGVEPHSYEPSPRDITAIQKADLFIYTGEFMEPWAHKVVEIVKNKKTVVVDVSKGILLLEETAHDEHAHKDDDESDHHPDQEHGHRHNHGGKDPHIWLDPVYAQTMVDNIVAGLVEADAKNKDFYVKNGEAYKQKLQKLHQKFTVTFQKTKSKKIIYGGHFAFDYFAKRYGLEHISPYAGFAPDAEPTPRRIAELMEALKKTGTKAIYYEELIDPKVAQVIAGQTGAKMILLHGAHNVTKQELNANVSYLSIMEQNLEKLKQGLGYNE